jgi:peptidoglycan/xylan/chitin deacetylase (PgdA/CDA1 family)
MGVGSHGIAHVDWTTLSGAALMRELTGSKQALEAILDQPVAEAGIPFGAWNGRVLHALRRAGYTAAYSSDRGPMDPGAFLRPRTSITAAMAPPAVAAVTDGNLSVPARLRRAAAMAAKRLRRGWA